MQYIVILVDEYDFEFFEKHKCSAITGFSRNITWNLNCLNIKLASIWSIKLLVTINL